MNFITLEEIQVLLTVIENNLISALINLVIEWSNVHQTPLGAGDDYYKTNIKLLIRGIIFLILHIGSHGGI